MSIITKQLILNEIQLPTDVVNIIKEFCFVNIEEVTKKNKLKINRIIQSADLFTYSWRMVIGILKYMKMKMNMEKNSN